MENSETVPMGIGPLGAERVFPRTFRFLFISKKNPEMQYFTNKVRINYCAKGVEIAVYERVTLQAHDWIVEMMKDDYADDFTLVALDGCGNKLYILEFLDVKLKDHLVEYDYAKSDVVQHNLTLGFREMVKTFSLPKDKCAWELDKNIGGEKK